MKYFKQEIESREMCCFVTSSSGKQAKRHFSGEKFTASALVASNESSQCNCVYCGKSHYSWKCFVVTDVSSRKAILRKKGRCFTCLQCNHISRYCPSKYKCVKCKRRHNVSICDNNRGTKGTRTVRPVRRLTRKRGTTT